MSNYKSKQFVEKLKQYAYEYIEECLQNTKEHATGSGKVVEVKDRHIPTIDYFLRIWIPKNGGKTIIRNTWYTWLNEEIEEGEENELKRLKKDTIKMIKNLFNALATDIVANEGKGIFYAKNALGMHDKQHIENKNVNKFDFDS